MIKVDIRKAYDSIEWDFLKATLLEYGFPTKLVQLIMTCVTTVRYSLLINGGVTPSFQAKKGLRQGDPISHYLFVLAMEYLNRSLKQLTLNPNFKYHPKCRKMELVHICFADDLLMYCRADRISIKLMLAAFEHFSNVSGLKANMDKSSFYVAGVTHEFKEQMVHELKFSLGTMPFKYLGVPLNTRKLTINDCMPLIEKIAARVRCWTSKMLSYSGRIQLIKSVLFEMQTYWAQVFVLPKKIINLVSGICRNFLWTGKGKYTKKALVAWDTLCLLKSTGGLNILNFLHWNKAAILKLLWAIAKKKEKLWVRWVYIKGNDIDTIPTPKQASWVVRKILDARYWLATGTSCLTVLDSFLDKGEFSIKRAYKSFLPQLPKATWKKLALAKGLFPKHQFILWLALQRRLTTVDRLTTWGIQVDTTCVLCSSQKTGTTSHMMFDCTYTAQIWPRLLNWVGIRQLENSWEEEVMWLSKVVGNKSPKHNILGFLYAAFVYHTWMERNYRRF